MIVAMIARAIESLSSEVLVSDFLFVSAGTYSNLSSSSIRADKSW
jgi:hypothetical protein